MEKEMRKIEEEFVFQEKWIELFKRGKFFFQNIPELLILKIITKLEAKDFLKILMTGKWMLLLCEENRNSLLIPLRISNYKIIYLKTSPEVNKKERNKVIQQLRKIIRSKYYFFLCKYNWYDNLMEYLYSKEAYHFRRECWNIGLLCIDNFPINISIINHLQPIIIEMNQSGPLSKNFYIPALTKEFFVYYYSINDSDFYKEIERFGSLPLKATFRREGHLELDELFSTLKGITQERHLHHPLQFLTYKRESLTKYAIFNSWPMYSFFSLSRIKHAIIKFWRMGSFFPPSESKLFYFIIVAKSDIGVSIIHLYRFASYRGQQLYTLQIMGIKSFDEWEKFTKSEIVDGDFDLEAGQTRETSDKQLAKVLEDFSAQIASKFFEGGKLVYPPWAPEPTREFVEFLKEFEDFDIQPEKLAPHKPKWKKTEKLPDLPQKLPEIHSNNWLIEAKEVIKLRKIWMDFLQKGKFILELLPEKFVLEVARRIEHKRFPLLFSSTKWVNELIQNSASTFRIHGGSSDFSMDRIYRDISDFKEALKSLEFYYLKCIRFNDFNANINNLKEVLQWVRERNIFVKWISLRYKCPLIQELFESFARGPESLLVDQYSILPTPVNFSPQLKEIEMDVGYFGGDQIDRIKKLIERFTGIEQAVIWRCSNDITTNKTITHQLKTLKSKMCRSNILIRSWNGRYLYIANYDPQFDLSQISETVFIFRSMARGRGGVWNYFIRLEQAGSGAVGIAHYRDSIQNEENKFRQFDIRCEYFPTMESFLDYFEREVGSKRRARDWMQLREKDGTIEPREDHFNDYKIRKPYIHFNEQKEADDFKEVQRRFFS